MKKVSMMLMLVLMMTIPSGLGIIAKRIDAEVFEDVGDMLPVVVYNKTGRYLSPHLYWLGTTPRESEGFLELMLEMGIPEEELPDIGPVCELEGKWERVFGPIPPRERMFLGLLEYPIYASNFMVADVPGGAKMCMEKRMLDGGIPIIIIYVFGRGRVKLPCLYNPSEIYFPLNIPFGSS